MTEQDIIDFLTWLADNKAGICKPIRLPISGRLCIGPGVTPIDRIAAEYIAR